MSVTTPPSTTTKMGNTTLTLDLINRTLDRLRLLSQPKDQLGVAPLPPSSAPREGLEVVLEGNENEK